MDGWIWRSSLLLFLISPCWTIDPSMNFWAEAKNNIIPVWFEWRGRWPKNIEYIMTTSCNHVRDHENWPTKFFFVHAGQKIIVFGDDEQFCSIESNINAKFVLLWLHGSLSLVVMTEVRLCPMVQALNRCCRREDLRQKRRKRWLPPGEFWWKQKWNESKKENEILCQCWCVMMNSSTVPASTSSLTAVSR